MAETARRPGAELPSPEVGREVMRQACARHGVPFKIIDPALLAKVAGMVLEVLDRKTKARSFDEGGDVNAPRLQARTASRTNVTVERAS